MTNTPKKKMEEIQKPSFFYIFRFLFFWSSSYPMPVLLYDFYIVIRSFLLLKIRSVSTTKGFTVSVA